MRIARNILQQPLHRSPMVRSVHTGRIPKLYVPPRVEHQSIFSRAKKCSLSPEVSSYYLTKLHDRGFVCSNNAVQREFSGICHGVGLRTAQQWLDKLPTLTLHKLAKTTPFSPSSIESEVCQLSALQQLQPIFFTQKASFTPFQAITAYKTFYAALLNLPTSGIHITSIVHNSILREPCTIIHPGQEATDSRSVLCLSKLSDFSLNALLKLGRNRVTLMTFYRNKPPTEAHMVTVYNSEPQKKHCLYDPNVGFAAFDNQNALASGLFDLLTDYYHEATLERAIHCHAAE